MWYLRPWESPQASPRTQVSCGTETARQTDWVRLGEKRGQLSDLISSDQNSKEGMSLWHMSVRTFAHFPVAVLRSDFGPRQTQALQALHPLNSSAGGEGGAGVPCSLPLSPCPILRLSQPVTYAQHLHHPGFLSCLPEAEPASVTVTLTTSLSTSGSLFAMASLGHQLCTGSQRTLHKGPAIGWPLHLCGKVCI